MSHNDWVDKMVSESKLYRPFDSGISIASTNSPEFDFTLNNIACGVITGGNGELSEGITRLCKVVGDAGASGLFLDMNAYVVDGLCANNRACDFVGTIILNTAGGFVEDGIGSSCTGIFQRILDSCPGETGGVAEIDMNDSAGQQQGTIEADFYDHDSGLTCPTNNDVDYCEKVSFN